MILRKNIDSTLWLGALIDFSLFLWYALHR